MSMEFRPFARILHDIERTRPVGLDADMRLKEWPEKAAARMKRFPDIDAVAVILRVPAHYELTMAALNAGKHVYTEWPLGQTTAEAQEMADLAQSKGLRNMVGLQSRANPAILYAKDLVAVLPNEQGQLD